MKRKLALIGFPLYLATIVVAVFVYGDTPTRVLLGVTVSVIVFCWLLWIFLNATIK